MKKLIHLLVIFQLFVLSSGAQDMFPVKQLATGPGRKGFPSGSPDGKRIAFNSVRPGTGGIWVMNVDIERIKKELLIIKQK